MIIHLLNWKAQYLLILIDKPWLVFGNGILHSEWSVAAVSDHGVLRARMILEIDMSGDSSLSVIVNRCRLARLENWDPIVVMRFNADLSVWWRFELSKGNEQLVLEKILFKILNLYHRFKQGVVIPRRRGPSCHSHLRLPHPARNSYCCWNHHWYRSRSFQMAWCSVYYSGRLVILLCFARPKYL